MAPVKHPISFFPVEYKPEVETTLNWKDKKYPNYVQEYNGAGHSVLLLHLSLHFYPLKMKPAKIRHLKPTLDSVTHSTDIY